MATIDGVESDFEVLDCRVIPDDVDNLTPLSLACKQGSVEMVKLLVKDGADIGAPGNDGKTALHYTCEGGNRIIDGNDDEKTDDFLEILQFLLDSGANVDWKDNMGRTPLFTACEADDIEMVSLLVRHNCDVNIQTVDGDCPIRVTCRNAKFWTYRPGSNNLSQNNPSEFPPIQITKVLLQANADISKATLLPTAVQYKDVGLVRELLELGMDINMLDDNQCTPLGAACSSVNVPCNIVKLLLEHGADVNKGGGWRKQKPLIFAYVHNSVEKIRLLLSYGASLTPDEMTELVSLSFSKSILENPEVIGPYSKELMSWRLLLAAGFQPSSQSAQLTYKMQQLNICSSYEKISPWIQSMLYPLYSLKEICRISIRNGIPASIDDNIRKMTLPKSLKDYLLFNEFATAESQTK
ncbi:putative ankyrin repeat protein RF_0381 [Ylistrum balloti]|uniref:putative ankyrin repeat protein RF_0381 n=1 Tax=Ylistrum balloti TaxID=509963 RepID=UPI002905BA76|nr:putative ankyrin repeat protein RF_0381 [Ylistrum balloti]